MPQIGSAESLACRGFLNPFLLQRAQLLYFFVYESNPAACLWSGAGSDSIGHYRWFCRPALQSPAAFGRLHTRYPGWPDLGHMERRY